jgi:antitoxin (DNA-binding transcriptional repressor) of toxin-antitoxin stability system
MLVINSSEFKAHQGKYLAMAGKGEEIVLTSRTNGRFKIVWIPNNEKDDDAHDSIYTEEEYYAKLDHSIRQAKEGKVIRQKDGESVKQFIERMLCTD